MDDNTRDVLNGLREDKAYATMLAIAVISKETPPAPPKRRRLIWGGVATLIASLALTNPHTPTLLRVAVEYWSASTVEQRP